MVQAGRGRIQLRVSQNNSKNVPGSQGSWLVLHVGGLLRVILAQKKSRRAEDVGERVWFKVTVPHHRARRGWPTETSESRFSKQ